MRSILISKSTNSSSTRGSSTVEAALIMPVIMFSILAVLLYGILLYQKTVLQCNADSISSIGASRNKDNTGILPKSFKTELEGKYKPNIALMPNDYGARKEYNFHLTSEAQIRDQPEFIRNIDLVLDLIASDKVQELISLLKNAVKGGGRSEK